MSCTVGVERGRNEGDCMCLDWRMKQKDRVSSHSPVRWLARLFTAGSDGERQPDGT